MVPAAVAHFSKCALGLCRGSCRIAVFDALSAIGFLLMPLPPPWCRRARATTALHRRRRGRTRAGAEHRLRKRTPASADPPGPDHHSGAAASTSARRLSRKQSIGRCGHTSGSAPPDATELDFGQRWPASGNGGIAWACIFVPETRAGGSSSPARRASLRRRVKPPGGRSIT